MQREREETGVSGRMKEETVLVIGTRYRVNETSEAQFPTYEMVTITAI